jgi:RNA polymerase sigma-70 factor (ECF subfamily)
MQSWDSLSPLPPWAARLVVLAPHPRWVLGGPSTRVASDPTNCTLDELMARLAEGDRAAFTPLFRRIWPPVLRLCEGLLRSDADAADAAQEAMAKVLIRAADYDPGRPALPWALAIASWECRTVLRRRVRRRESLDSTASILARDVSGEDEAIQRQLTAAALEVLGSLSEVDRETLLATFWEEAPSVGGATLRKRRERALGRLRSAFRRLYGLD